MSDISNPVVSAWWWDWWPWCRQEIWQAPLCYQLYWQLYSVLIVYPMRNKWAPWAHCELTVTTVVTAPGPNDHGSFTARLGHGEVTAQSRRGHSSITVIMAQSWLGHSSITAQVTAQSQLPVTILVTISSPRPHRQLTVSSHGGQFFSHGICCGSTRSALASLSDCLSMKTMSATGVSVSFGPSMAELWLKWMFTALCLKWKPLSAT